MEKEAVLTAVDRAFGAVPRPSIMVRNPNHCDECADHEAAMQGVTPQTVTLNEIGNMGWDPVCYLTDASYRYFMPGFARLVLHTDDDCDYLDQFIFHLESRLSDDLFTGEQRTAIIGVIDYLKETLPEELLLQPPSYIDSLERIRDMLTAEAS